MHRLHDKQVDLEIQGGKYFFMNAETLKFKI